MYSDISVTDSGSLTLAPGVYTVTGSLSVSGSGVLTGNGVTIDLECAAFPSPCTRGSWARRSQPLGTSARPLPAARSGQAEGFAILGARSSQNSVGVSGTAQLKVGRLGLRSP